MRERDYAIYAQRAELHQLWYIASARRSRARTRAWTYVERIEVKDFDQHRKDLASPEGKQLLEELYGQFLDRSKNIYITADVIE